jgi:sphingomyelin phosphodiesterase
MWYAYLAMSFFVSIYLGERYIYYSTGMAGFTPTHSKHAQEDLRYYDYQGFGWKFWKASFSSLRTIVASNVTISLIEPIVKTVWSLATDQKIMCDQFFDSFGYGVFSNLMERVFDVNYIWTCIGLWDEYYYQDYKASDYINRMMAGQPRITRNYPQKTPEKIIRMLQISDAHVDRGYLEGSNPDCTQASWWRDGNGPPKNEIPGYWGFVGRWDIPMRTAEVGLDYIMDQNVDFIIWTGDNLDHYIWYQTFENQFFNQRYLKEYIIEKLNYTGPIYPVLGNHEGVPTDMFDFELNKWVFEVFGEIWKDYLTPEAYRNMSNYGYYHMKHLDTNLRIIGTFSMTYDIQNWYLIPNHTDPIGELKFLEETLKLWEHNNEVAYILGHIPPGDIFTLGEWSTRYRALVNRFTNIIRGQFFGHTHYDEFKNVKSFRNDELSAGTVWATASFTSYPKKQPGLRIWEVDEETWHLWNYEQHRMYINQTNKAADELRAKRNYTEEELRATGKWELAYKFVDYYGLKSMDFEEIAKLIEKIKDNKYIAKKIITMMHGEGPDSIERQNQVYWTYWRFANSVFDDHWIWNGNSGDVLDYVFQGIQFAHGKSGQWWSKEPAEKYIMH